MTKQVHIHIHRTKARDAGEGEGKGKWITLSPSGTHVEVDGKGEITAGPKGMSGKKPSELSKKSGSTPAPGKNNEPSTQQVAKHAGKKVQPSKPGWALRADPGLAAKFEAAEARSKAKKLERETGAGSLTKAQQARQFEDTPHDPTGMAHAGRPQGTAAVQARIDAKKAAGKPAGEGPRGASRVGSAGPATTKTDWSKSNGDWTTAKKEGAEMFERAMSSAKSGGARTDAALKLKAEAAEQQKKGSYLGAVVLGLANDYFDRLK